MSLEAQRVYLLSRFKQVATGLPMAYPNQKFDKPKDKPYGEFHIMGGDPITIGSEGAGKVRVRYVHMLQMTIWVPAEKGTKDNTVAGDAFKNRFANRQGRDPSGAFYRFQNLQTFATQKTPQGWDATVFRIGYTRDVIEDVDPGLTL